MYIAFRILGRESWCGAPCKGFQFLAWDSLNRCLHSAKCLGPAGGWLPETHDIRNRRLKANNSVQDTHV